MSAKPTADGTPQKRLNIDVPDELAKQFKAYAALQGKSQREIFIAFMQRCVRRSTDPKQDGYSPQDKN
uniref:hypothetical protein n=1 Tax=Arthrobacter sp. TaxID=1667 RepID=UPI00159EC8D1|nr:hypothetical protein [Arthrobacter sp.]